MRKNNFPHIVLMSAGICLFVCGVFMYTQWFESLFSSYSAHAATFQIKTGYYMGDGIDNKKISGLGFHPDLIITKKDTNTGSDGAHFKTSVMSGEQCQKLAQNQGDTSCASNIIQSLDSDGFTLGSGDANVVNNRFTYIAFGGSDCSESGTFCVGSYMGNGSTTQVVSSVGFQPDLVIIKSTTTDYASWRSSAMPTNVSQYFYGGAQVTGGTLIKTLDATGFTVGSSANTNAIKYYYIAFKSVSGAMAVGSYVGNGVTGRNISGFGASSIPNFAWVKATTTQVAYYNVTDSYGEYSSGMTKIANATNVIKKLQLDGFQVGTSAVSNGSGSTYYWAAFGGEASPTPSGSFYMKVGSYTGTATNTSLTGVGFSPDTLFIKDNSTGAHVFRTSQMKGDTTAYTGSAATDFVQGIRSLNTDGFTIGTSTIINTSARTYQYVVFGNAFNPETNSGASDFEEGVYIGNGINNRIITTHIVPDFVFIKQNSTGAAVVRSSTYVGDNSQLLTNTATTTKLIISIATSSIPNSFEVGTSTVVNGAGSLYRWIAFRVGNGFKIGQYTGNGVNGRQITGLGFSPNLTWVLGAGTQAKIHRSSSLTGDSAQYFAGTANATGKITALLPDGFQLGTGAETNTNAVVYRYMSWHIPPPYISQTSYRWFENTNSTDVGSPLASQNTTTTISSSGGQVRLRVLLDIATSSLETSGKTFKLQFANKGVGTCASPTGGYLDVGTSTAIAFFDNTTTTATNGAALTANSNDPVYGIKSISNQSYVEGNTFTNAQGIISIGQNGKWDFSLVDNSAPSNTTYCFRIVDGDGTEIDGYDVYPEITTAEQIMVSCSASPTTTDFGQLSIASVGTSDPVITLTSSCGSASGCSVYVNDFGSGSSPGLWNASVSDILGSSDSTLVAGVEGYGIQATSTTNGSGGILLVDQKYNKTGNNVGGLLRTATNIAGSTNSFTDREITVIHKASASSITSGGSYSDTITYSCVAN